MPGTLIVRKWHAGQQYNDIHGGIEWHHGVISDSILALKDLCTEDVPEHSLHARDAFKILGWSRPGEIFRCKYAQFARRVFIIIPSVLYIFKKRKKPRFLLQPRLLILFSFLFFRKWAWKMFYVTANPHHG